MKNKKKLCIIGVSALCIVAAVVLCITLIPKHNGDKPAESEAKETSSGSIVIDEPEKDTQSDETKNVNEDDKLADDGKGRLNPEVENDDISLQPISLCSARAVSEHSLMPEGEAAFVLLFMTDTIRNFTGRIS